MLVAVQILDCVRRVVFEQTVVVCKRASVWAAQADRLFSNKNHSLYFCPIRVEHLCLIYWAPVLHAVFESVLELLFVSFLQPQAHLHLADLPAEWANLYLYKS